MDFLESLKTFWESTGVYRMIQGTDAAWWQTVMMFVIVCVLAYLAIKKRFEPLLLLPIAVGMLLTNLPGGEMFHSEFWFCDVTAINDLVARCVEAYANGDAATYNALVEELAQYQQWRCDRRIHQLCKRASARRLAGPALYRR